MVDEFPQDKHCHGSRCDVTEDLRMVSVKGGGTVGNFCGVCLDELSTEAGHRATQNYARARAHDAIQKNS